jgi:hypothetical protein
LTRPDALLLVFFVSFISEAPLARFRGMWESEDAESKVSSWIKGCSTLMVGSGGTCRVEDIAGVLDALMWCYVQSDAAIPG